MEFTANNVEEAVSQFYSNSDHKHHVHTWLTKARVAKEAWAFVWELLEPQKSEQVQFFAASCLYQKITSHSHEVSASDYEVLKKKLLEKFVAFSEGPKMVFTRLSVALASAILQTLPEMWPQSIANLIETFNPTNFPNVSERNLCKALLEILTVIPIEFFSVSFIQYRRGVIKNTLNTGLKDVIALLQRLISASPTDVQLEVLTCMNSWVEFGIPLNESEQLIIQTFDLLHKPELYESSADVLCVVFSHPDSHRFPYTIQKLSPHILELQPVLKTLIEERKLEECAPICQLVMAIAETHSKLILNSFISSDETQQQNSLNLIYMVMTCTGLPGYFPVDETSSQLTFNFWYSIQDELVDVGVNVNSHLMPIFHEIYSKLTEILLRKVQYPPESEYRLWSSDQKEQFRCYRHDIGDTMMYSFTILQDFLLPYLWTVLNTSVQNGEQWQVFEGIFFLYTAIAERVELTEKTYLPALLNFLPQVPITHPILIATTLGMIGSYAEWLNWNPNILQSVIPMLLRALQNTEVVTPASLALKDITRETHDHIHPFADQILTACWTMLEKNLKSKDAVRMMAIAGHVLSTLNFTDIMQYLDKLLAPQMWALSQLAKEEPNSTVQDAIVQKLEMLSWLISTITSERGETEEVVQENHHQNSSQSNPNPVLVIMQRVAPILQDLMIKWTTNAVVIQSVCELFRKTLRALMDDFAPLANDSFQMFTQMYHAYPHSAILGIAKHAILMFHRDETLQTSVKELLGVLTVKSLTVLHNDFREHTDIVEGLMNLWAQIIKKSRLLVSTQGDFDLESLFQSAVLGLALPETFTIKASAYFLQEFLIMGNEVPWVKELIQKYGGDMIIQVLKAIEGGSSRTALDQFADLLLCINKHQIDELTKFVSNLNKTCLPLAMQTMEQREQFCRHILREKSNRRKVREFVKEYYMQCHGLIGTEYGNQWAQSI